MSTKSRKYIEILLWLYEMCLLLCNIIVLSVFENCEKSLLFLLSIMILLLILFNLIDMHGKNIKKKKNLWFSHNKERNPAIYNNVDEPWGHYITWNKSDRDISHDLTYMWSLKHTHAKSLQLCPTFCNSMDCSPPVSSVHRILQARILEWITIPFSRLNPILLQLLHCRRILYGGCSFFFFFLILFYF